MQERGLNQLELARLTGVRNTNISNFLIGLNQPSYKNLIKLLYFFNCSADYMLGLIEFDTQEKPLPVLPFGPRLKSILKEYSVPQEKLIKELPVSSSVLYKWLAQISYPSPDNLIKLAKYFDVSVDYLILSKLR